MSRWLVFPDGRIQFNSYSPCIPTFVYGLWSFNTSPFLEWTSSYVSYLANYFGVYIIGGNIRSHNVINLKRFVLNVLIYFIYYVYITTDVLNRSLFKRNIPQHVCMVRQTVWNILPVTYFYQTGQKRIVQKYIGTKCAVSEDIYVLRMLVHFITSDPFSQ